MLEILISIILFCIVFHVSKMPGEIMAPYAKMIYLSKLKGWQKKILTCASCISFWMSLIVVLYYKESISYVFGVYLIVYFITRYIK